MKITEVTSDEETKKKEEEFEESENSGDDTDVGDISEEDNDSRPEDEPGKLPDHIRNFRPPKIRSRKVTFDDDCDDCCENEAYEESDSPRKKKKKSSGFFTKERLVVAIMIFPMLFSAVLMSYEMFAKFNSVKTSTIQMTAVAFGAVIAFAFMTKIPAARSALKVILCFVWIVFLVPTYQVYSCSPIELKNDMLGTWFSLKTNSRKFLEQSYIKSECFNAKSFQTPFFLSLMSPKISLRVDISDIINLTQKNEEEGINEADRLSYFLLVSKRSVKRKFHKLHLPVLAVLREAQVMSAALKMSREEKQSQMLQMTGSISNLGEPWQPLKQELEKMSYLVRPIKYRVHSVKLVSRYAKLKPDEHLY